MRKLIALSLSVLLILGATAALADFAADTDITVMSREDGSGTRGAFIELLGVEVKNDAGEKVDMTTDEAIITNSTSVMLTGVARDPYAIGYISLGSLNDTVRALAIDGADATVDNIKSGEYAVSRPFTIATDADTSEAAQDFIAFILSAQGQAVIEENGYIAVSEAASDYAGSATGKIVVAGSSSITPVMEKLKEAYIALNPDAAIEIQQSDSTTGVQQVLEGIADIGMASRALKDSELEKGLTATEIALDGIAVIVNLDNPTEGLTAEAVRAIYAGEAVTWAEALEAE